MKQKQNVAHLPNAWNPCGPSAGMANNVIASIRNLNQVSIPMQATEKTESLMEQPMHPAAHAPCLVANVSDYVSCPILVLLKLWTPPNKIRSP